MEIIIRNFGCFSLLAGIFIDCDVIVAGMMIITISPPLSSYCHYHHFLCRNNTYEKNQPAVLYNAMIHPFLPMPIFGAIWYQGESNTIEEPDYQDAYGCAIKEMVNDWRAKWFDATGGQTNSEFPFGQCQVIIVTHRV